MEGWTPNTILNWNHRGILELPSELERYGSDVREIHLQHNRITTLPPWITYLRNLSALYLDNNNLRDIPEEIGTLAQLTDLNLSSNCLSRLPQEIRSLHSLTSLIITDNNLTNLPDFRQLRALERLDVSYNGIRCLPPSVGALRNLQELCVDSNPLFELPPSVFGLPHLRELSANCCDLRCLPALPLAARPMPNITFKLNPALKHVPLTLEPLFESNPHICTRFWTYDSTQFSHPGQIHVKVASSRNLPEIDVYLNSGLKHITNHTSHMQLTLYELAMRKSHTIFCKFSNSNLKYKNDGAKVEDVFYDNDSFFGSSDIDAIQDSTISSNDANNNYENEESPYIGELPQILCSQLREGPSAICQNCKVGLFQYGVLCFLHRHVRRTFGDCNLLCSVMFCGSECAKSWNEMNPDLTYLPWSIISDLYS